MNKPIGLSTFDLIRLFKRANPTFKGKIGHAGTLDVFAQGLVILLINTTKHFAHFQTLTKDYQAGVRLGASSPTLDIEGALTEKPLDFYPSFSALQALLPQFVGSYNQTIPQYSAAKQGGKSLYSLARRGATIIPKSKPVTIDSLELIAYKYPLVNIKVICSSGTYIRQLTFDIFKKLDIDSLLFSLTRTQIGEYQLKNSISPTEFGDWEKNLISFAVK